MAARLPGRAFSSIDEPNPGGRGTWGRARKDLVVEWVSRKPGFVGGLEQVADRCKTPSARKLISGYQKYLAANGNRPPRFTDLDIADFVASVPHIALCSVIKDRSCEFRIIGEELNQRMGFPAPRVNYYDYVPPNRVASVKRVMEMVVGIPCGFRADLEQVYSSGQSMQAEAVGLPLAPGRDGEDGQILFSDQMTEDLGFSADKKQTLLGANLLQRDFVDLGFGIDQTYEDLVRI